MPGSLQVDHRHGGDLTTRWESTATRAVEAGMQDEHGNTLGVLLTVDEAITRYLRHIADGPECVAELRRLGFVRWLSAFRRSHQEYANKGGRNEWDSRDYSDEEMREIYDGIMLHAGRSAVTS